VLVHGRIRATLLACLVAFGVLSGIDLASDRASAASWTVSVVDSLGNVGPYSEIAVDVAGRPHISYEDATTQALKHAWHDGVAWNLETVRAVGCPEIFTSLALDSLGRPHIAYHSCGSLMHSWWTGLAWIHETVDSPNVGTHNSIALDSADRPRISYYDDGNRWLMFAEWDGLAWNFQSPDTANLVGEWNSLALDSLERPHISYYRRNGNNLRYVKWNGTAWENSLVDSAGQVGYDSSLALDGNDYAHIAYHGSSARVLKYARWDGALWNVQTVDTVGLGGTVGSQALSLDAAENPQIAYQDITAGDLKYARWTGTAWNLTVVDASVSDVGSWPSLALDGTGTAHVSYYDATAGDLKYAVLTNLPPTTPSTPSGPTPGITGTSYPYSTSSADPDGDPIMYTFDWGDATTSDTGFNASGVPVTLSHAWAAAGTYAVRARAMDPGGAFSGWSAALTVTIVSPPTAPLTLGAAAGDAQINLTWSAPASEGGSPITNYRIYRGTTPGGEVFLVEIGNLTAYDDTGLTNGQAYYYVVTAVNWAGEGPASNEATATPAGAPGAPTGLAAFPGDTQVILTWTAPASDGGSPITNYTIYRGLSSGGEAFLVQIGNVLTHTDLGLTNGVTYYYTVSAVNAIGEGPPSNEANATPSAAPSVPSAPQALGAVAGNAQVDLTWSAPASDGGSPITNYTIYRGLSSGGEAFLVQIGNVLTHTDLGLTNGVTYYYEVSAVNAIGEGPLSNEASATPATIPSAPSSLVATPGNGQSILTWSAPGSDGGAPITNYRVHRGLSPGGEAFLVQIGNVLTYTNLGLTNGVTYYYEVSAVNAIGEGPLSNEASATPATVPTEPLNPQAFAASAQITLTWNSPASDGGLSINNYRVYRGLAPGTEVFLVEIGAVLTYVDGGLLNGQEYCYIVSAVNAVGEGPQSNEACATPTAGPSVPSAPQALAAAGGDAQVVLTWGAPASDGGSVITNYRVHRSMTSGAEVFLVEIGNVLTYTDVTVVNGQIYYYQVSAVNAVGEGPRSSEASATPSSPATPPSAPQNLAATGGNGVVALTWQAPLSDGGSPLTNYRIYRGTTAGGEAFLFETGNVLAYSDTGVANGQTYYYVVHARNGVGEGPQSNEASATPSAPANLPPTCTFMAPIPNETISGVYTVLGIATDPDGSVQFVEVRIDGGAWNLATLGPSWSYALNTAATSDGPHSLTARSYDGSNYSAEVTVTITVRNAGTPPPGDPTFDQRWFWAALLLAIVLGILFWIFFVRRRKEEDEEEPKLVEEGSGNAGDVATSPAPPGEPESFGEDENPLE
jgi:titin